MSVSIILRTGTHYNDPHWIKKPHLYQVDCIEKITTLDWATEHFITEMGLVAEFEKVSESELYNKDENVSYNVEIKDDFCFFVEAVEDTKSLADYIHMQHAAKLMHVRPQTIGNWCRNRYKGRDQGWKIECYKLHTGVRAPWLILKKSLLNRPKT